MLSTLSMISSCSLSRANDFNLVTTCCVRAPDFMSKLMTWVKIVRRSGIRNQEGHGQQPPEAVNLTDAQPRRQRAH